MKIHFKTCVRVRMTLVIFENTNGNNWTNSRNWATKNPLKYYKGVVTNENNFSNIVLELNLTNNGLCGSIPKCIWKLQTLTKLNLSKNKIKCDIDLGAMMNLKYINLSYTSDISTEMLDYVVDTVDNMKYDNPHHNLMYDFSNCYSKLCIPQLLKDKLYNDYWEREKWTGDDTWDCYADSKLRSSWNFNNIPYNDIKFFYNIAKENNINELTKNISYYFTPNNSHFLIAIKYGNSDFINILLNSMSTHEYILNMCSGEQLKIHAPKDINATTLCSLVKNHKDITVTLYIESREEPLHNSDVVLNSYNIYAIPT